MRPDSALSHLYDGEICVADMKDDTKRKICWSKSDWCFYYVDTPTPTVCNFDDIKEWRLESITV